MIRQFSPETQRAVLGYVEVGEQTVIRAPLHVDFEVKNTDVPAAAIAPEELQNPAAFNAIGSAALYVGTRRQDMVTGHLPLIDADGGAKKLDNPYTDKVTINAAPGIRRPYIPYNLLEDVLGKYDIDVRVFEAQELEGSMAAALSDAFVTSIVLRSREKGVFEVIRSTQRDHAHVYIQKLFTTDDHRVLMESLEGVGVITPNWASKAIASRVGGVLRTPWTNKPLGALPS